MIPMRYVHVINFMTQYFIQSLTFCCLKVPKFAQLPSDKNLYYFWFIAIINNAAANVCMLIF